MVGRIKQPSRIRVTWNYRFEPKAYPARDMPFSFLETPETNQDHRNQIRVDDPLVATGWVIHTDGYPEGSVKDLSDAPDNW